jgi:hypothetical protein
MFRVEALLELMAEILVRLTLHPANSRGKESRAVSETGLSASMIHTPGSATREKEHKDWRCIQLWLDDGGSHFCALVLLPMELAIRPS